MYQNRQVVSKADPTPILKTKAQPQRKRERKQEKKDAQKEVRHSKKVRNDQQLTMLTFMKPDANLEDQSSIKSAESGYSTVETLGLVTRSNVPSFSTLIKEQK